MFLVFLSRECGCCHPAPQTITMGSHTDDPHTALSSVICKVAEQHQEAESKKLKVMISPRRQQKLLATCHQGTNIGRGWNHKWLKSNKSPYTILRNNGKGKIYHLWSSFFNFLKCKIYWPLMKGSLWSIYLNKGAQKSKQ